MFGNQDDDRSFQKYLIQFLYCVVLAKPFSTNLYHDSTQIGVNHGSIQKAIIYSDQFIIGNLFLSMVEKDGLNEGKEEKLVFCHAWIL